MADKEKQEGFTVAGTNIEAVKRDNELSGMSYNEVKKFLAQSTGGHGTSIYTDTNIENVKEKNRQSEANRKTD